MGLHDDSSSFSGRQRRITAGIAASFAMITVLAGFDLVADVAEGTTIFHVLVEGGVLLIGIVGLVFMSRRFMALSRTARALTSERGELAVRLEATREDAERWRKEAADLLRGLGVSIDEQLSRWALTPAEKEVALLLLKGLSLKEVAAVREVGEATARQQARAVYRKAGLAGRSELAAFFLEDLLLPPSGDVMRD